MLKLYLPDTHRCPGLGVGRTLFSKASPLKWRKKHIIEKQIMEPFEHAQVSLRLRETISRAYFSTLFSKSICATYKIVPLRFNASHQQQQPAEKGAKGAKHGEDKKSNFPRSNKIEILSRSSFYLHRHRRGLIELKLPQIRLNAKH